MSQLEFKLGYSGRRATLTKPYLAHVDDELTILVPAGFTTDFASVPRALWSIVPPWGPYAPATVVHDYLYVTGMFSRKRADKIFLKLMEKLKVEKWKRAIMYCAVRIGGSKPWDKYRLKDKK